MNPGEFSWFWGVLVPGFILAVSVFLTVWLYRHFARQTNPGPSERAQKGN